MFWHFFLTSLAAVTAHNAPEVLSSLLLQMLSLIIHGQEELHFSSFSSFLVWSMERLLPHNHLQILPLGHAWPGSQPMWSPPCTPLPFPRLTANLIAWSRGQCLHCGHGVNKMPFWHHFLGVIVANFEVSPDVWLFQHLASVVVVCKLVTWSHDHISLWWHVVQEIIAWLSCDREQWHRNISLTGCLLGK